MIESLRAEWLASGPGGRAAMHRLSAAASLSVGLHAEALDAARRARRGAPASEAAVLGLTEAEALSALQRHREALSAASRALASRPADADVAARLRLLRGHSLWMLGRVSAGAAELRRAAEEAAGTPTHAAAQEALGHLAWKARDLASAEEHLEQALRAHARCGNTEGLVSALARRGAVLSSAGRFSEALRVHGLRVEIASTSTRQDALALAHFDRGDLLSNLGRWPEARRALERSAELFRRVSDPREQTLAGRGIAMLELAAGDVAGARRAAEGAGHLPLFAEDNPRQRAEHLLVMSDVELCSGDPLAADAAAAEALALFALVKDTEGEARGRVRRAHALLGAGRIEDALREARRAVR